MTVRKTNSLTYCTPEAHKYGTETRFLIFGTGIAK